MTPRPSAAAETRPAPADRPAPAVRRGRDGRLVGFAAVGPGEDEDLDLATTAEILTLLVDPGSTGRGHGSRLLAATVEQLREAGFTTTVIWLFTADRADGVLRQHWVGLRRCHPDARHGGAGSPAPPARQHTSTSAAEGRRSDGRGAMGSDGFPEEALLFYEGLEVDNSKAYWTDHRHHYEEAVRSPMLALLDALEPEFSPARMFRPYRDVRFS